MNIHHLKNLLTESLVLGALLFYLAMVFAALVGLASWILGGQEFVSRHRGSAGVPPLPLFPLLCVLFLDLTPESFATAAGHGWQAG